MATVTITLPEQLMALLNVKAETQGLSVEDWLQKLAEEEALSTSVAHLQTTNPEEWIRHFEAFLASNDPNTPVLSDEAMSRESIYSDRD